MDDCGTISCTQKKREEGGFFMDPKVKTGIGIAQKGVKVAKVGKKALDI